MDSLAAAPGTGPATSPLPTVRRVRSPKTFAELPTDRTLVMGVLNVTPDSFSDGGKYKNVDDAIAHGLKMHYAGADIIDVGGESTRPGAERVPEDEEQRRVLPVVQALVKAGVLVSVDTVNASTARAAIEAGAKIINDVSGLNFDAEMPSVIAQNDVWYVLMHRRGDAQTMDSQAQYGNLISEVVAEMNSVKERFVSAGVDAGKIIADPGLGFAKTAEDNWQLIAEIARLYEVSDRILVGTSRKRFLGALLSRGGKEVPPQERDAATIATTAHLSTAGVWGVRVHDVPGNLAAVLTMQTIDKARTESGL